MQPSFSRLLCPATLVLVALLSFACSDSHRARHGDGDAGVADAATSQDGACIDRGRYAIDDLEVRGLTQTCDAELACVQGKCVELPACAPGVHDECLIVPPDRARVIGGRVLSVADTLYWLEAAVDDAGLELSGNGRLVRMRMGEWKREELATKLDYAQGASLWAEKERVFAAAPSLFDALTGEPIVRDNIYEPTCVGAGSGFSIESVYDDAQRTFKNRLFRRALGEVVDVPPEELTSTKGSRYRCVLIGEHLYAAFGNELRQISLAKLPMSKQLTKGSPVLLGSFGAELIAYSNDSYGKTWIRGTLPGPNLEAGSWRSIAGGTVRAGSSPVQMGSYVYWSRTSVARHKALVLRSPLDGSGRREVVAELWDVLGEKADASFVVVDGGVVWRRPDGALHFKAVQASETITPETADPCAEDNGGCDPHTLCWPDRGKASCSACATGYQGDGVSGCTDVDECRTDHGGCDATTTCTNTVGSRMCGACPAELVDVWGDGTLCTERLQSLVATREAVCGLRADASALCWGGQAQGITPAPDSEHFVQLSAGYTHVCGLRADGTLRCWGDPTAFEGQPADETFVRIACGWGSTCGLRADGSLRCWGSYAGTLSVPTGRGYKELGVGDDYICALNADGRPQCSTSARVPDERLHGLGVGWYNACALASDQTARCWGYDEAAGTNVQVPTELQDITFKQLAVSNVRQAGLTTEGEAIFWGSRAGSQKTFVRIEGHRFVAMTTHCGLREDGAVLCWQVQADGSLSFSHPAEGP